MTLGTTTGPAAPGRYDRPMPQTSNATRDVPTRRISFDEALATIPKHFATDGDLILSHLAAALSAVFPDGEDFFVKSVRNYRDKITDPDLKRQVNGFIGQESMHGRVHRAFNDRLDELGYPTKMTERRTRWMLKQQSKVMSKQRQLAVTAALEHFTATLAELLLSNPDARNLFGDDVVREIFLWHALEESEHKAVAFDVYRAVGGSERLRVWTMNTIRFGFVIGTAIQVVITVLLDPASRQRGVLRKSVANFRRSPLWSRELWAQLRDYNRPDFHPDDQNTDELVATWRAELFGDSGLLNDKLAAAS